MTWREVGRGVSSGSNRSFELFSLRRHFWRLFVPPWPTLISTLLRVVLRVRTIFSSPLPADLIRHPTMA